MVKSIDNVGITFVNTVLGRGILNGVINIQLGAFQFSENEQGDGVEPDQVVVARLRMDRVCAEQLYINLGELLQRIATAEGQVAAADTAETEEAAPAEPKLN